MGRILDRLRGVYLWWVGNYPLPERGIVELVGAVTAVDDGVNKRTKITIGAAAGASTHADADTLLLRTGDGSGELEDLQLDGTLTFTGTDGAAGILQAQRSGTGSATTPAITITAATGQNQGGSNGNNNGGDVIVAGGTAGTGGSGAAGKQGRCEISGGDLYLFGGASTAIAGSIRGFVTVVAANQFTLNVGNAQRIAADATGLAFFNATPIARPTVSGSRADTEAALKNLLSALANLGLITNTTTT